MKASSHDLAKLMKWAEREPWSGAFHELLDDHLGEACRDAGVKSFGEIAEIVGEHWIGILWGCIFEDLLTRHGEDGNIVDEYLKRRGWRESPGNKAYMQALRNSVMSLYEVSDIVPGKSFLARDLLRGGDPVRVSERSATKTIKPWDRLAMRVVEVRGKTIISGGLLPFEHKTSEKLMEAIRQIGEAAPGRVREMMEDLDVDMPDEILAEDFVHSFARDTLMRVSAPMFTQFWLTHVIEQARGPRIPDLVNSDGEKYELIRIRYRLGKGVTQKRIRALFADVPALAPASAKFWNWLRPAEESPPDHSGPTEGRMLTSTMEDGSVVLGNLSLEGRILLVEVNSEPRSERVRAMLEPLLDGLVGAPLTERQTVAQFLAEAHEDAGEDEELDLTLDERKAIIQEEFDRRYRAILDEPVPALGNISPRESVRSEAGERKVVDWLKYLENQTAKYSADDPVGGYDFGWMWRELGVERLRK